RREYGYDIPGRVVEVVNCRMKAVGLIDRPEPRFAGPAGPQPANTRRMVHFDDGWAEAAIIDRDGLAASTALPGPLVVEEMSATTLVPPGWSLTVDASGNLLLEAAP
ncbi:MAG TPA: hydantoinase/oxoprolinase family protein, partial [Acetobacteraceae bacterium]